MLRTGVIGDRSGGTARPRCIILGLARRCAASVPRAGGRHGDEALRRPTVLSARAPRNGGGETWSGAALAALVFAALMALQFALPPFGFFSGDCGVKYLMARAVAERGPLDPTLDYPARDVDASCAGRNRFLVPRGDRFIALFPPLLPTLGAGLSSLFGPRGLYVVPAAGAALAAWAVRRLAARRMGRAGAFATGFGAAFATPVFFYGLEFWEHAPAAGLVAAAALLSWPGDEAAARRRGRDLAAGALLGLAVAFRAEAAMAGPALYAARLLVALREAEPGPRRRYAFRAVAAAACFAGLGALSPLLGEALWNRAALGQVVPPQAAFNVAGSNSFLGSLRESIHDNLLPRRGQATFAALAAAGLAATWLLRRIGRRGASRTAAAATVATWSVFAFVLPAIDLLRGCGFGDSFAYRSAIHTWAFAAALLLAAAWTMRGSGGDGAQEGREEAEATGSERAPAWLGPASGGLFFVLLATPATAIPGGPGGFHWGARLLLPAAPLLWLAACQAIAECRERRVSFAAVGLLLLSFGVQLVGVGFLAHEKRLFDGLTRALAAATDDGEIVATDQVWLAQVAAPLYESRRMVSVRGDDDLRALAAAGARLRSAGVRISAATVPSESNWRPPAEISLPGVALRRDEGRALSPRGLVLWRYAAVATPGETGQDGPHRLRSAARRPAAGDGARP